jgi:hypothetical protein
MTCLYPNGGGVRSVGQFREVGDSLCVTESRRATVISMFQRSSSNVASDARRGLLARLTRRGPLRTGVASAALIGVVAGGVVATSKSDPERPRTRTSAADLTNMRLVADDPANTTLSGVPCDSLSQEPNAVTPPRYDNCISIPTTKLPGETPYGVEWLRWNQGWLSESYYISPRKTQALNDWFERHADEAAGVAGGAAGVGGVFACSSIPDGRGQVLCGALAAAAGLTAYGAAKDAARNASKDGACVKFRMWGGIAADVDRTEPNNKFCHAASITDGR